MIVECPGCAQEEAQIQEPSRVRAKLPWLGFVPAVLYVLAPKCPMCIIAYLSAFGVTVGMATFALSVLGPLTIVSVVLALGFAIWHAKGNRGRRHTVSVDAVLSRTTPSRPRS